MMTKRFRAACAPRLASGLCLCATLSLPAQQVLEGYAEVMTPLAASAGNVLTTNAGTVYFDGFDLMLDSGSGGQSLLTFAAYTFGSFSAPIGATAVLFGESSAGEVWKVPLNGAPSQLVTVVPFNYDAVLLDQDRALVSARTGGFGAPNNDVMFVDLVTGQSQLVARFPGASGPLAIDAAGDVYYATSPATFPAPSGTVEVFRLGRATVDAAIANNTVLGAANATLVMQGLDAAGDLAFDDDGDLFFVDWYNGRIGAIQDADGPQPSLAPTLIDFAGTGLYGSGLQFLPGAAAGPVFAPFQPAGGSLLVYETDYVSVNQARAVSAARPSLTASTGSSPVPAGPFTLDTIGGPANGLGLLLWTPTAPAGPVALTLGGMQAPLFLDGATTSGAIALPFAFDVTGYASLGIVNPGFATAFASTAQTVVFSAPAGFGSSNSLQLQISQ